MMQPPTDDHVARGARYHVSMNAAGEMTPPQSPYSVDLQVMRPGCEQVDVQSELPQPGGSRLSELSRELPMPITTQLTSLGQAHATLEHCSHKLIKLAQQHSRGSSTPGRVTIFVAEKRHELRSWLERWEKAFATYLAAAMSAMSTEEITRSRVLKANHLACTIVASASTIEPSAWDRFMPEFEAILELAGAVVQAGSAVGHSHERGLETNAPGLGAGMSVAEPLYVIVARCRSAAVRGRAVELLSRCPRRAIAWHSTDRPRIDTSNLNPPTSYQYTNPSPVSPSFSSTWSGSNIDAEQIHRLNASSAASTPTVTSRVVQGEQRSSPESARRTLSMARRPSPASATIDRRMGQLALIGRQTLPPT